VDYDDYDMLEWTDGRGRGWGLRVTSITLNNARAAGLGGGGVVVSSSWLFVGTRLLSWPIWARICHLHVDIIAGNSV